MSGIAFRTARGEDRAAVLAFLDAFWDGPDPHYKQEALFGYYFADEAGGLRFALAEAEGRICALAGWIPASRAAKPDVWVSFFIADPAVRGAGLELMAALPDLIGCRTLACNNIRANTRPLYEFLGYATGRVGHFYRLSAGCGRFEIAQTGGQAPLPAGGGGRLVPLATPEALRQSGFMPPEGASPYKDFWYLQRRYFGFPGQSTALYGGVLPGQSAPAALFALRRVVPTREDGRPTENAVLRVADYLGDAALLPHFGGALDALLAEWGAEYAEFYCAGIPAATLAEAGFSERAEGEEGVVLPAYLTPVLQRNIDYHYFTSRPEGFRLCKADGDQDRPRFV